MSKKEKFLLYLSPEKRPSWSAGIRRMGAGITAFIERAVDFYLDYLSANNAGLFLPTSIKSYVDGRLGQLRIGWPLCCTSKQWSRHVVAYILADAYQFNEDDLQRRRTESINNVKKTNGRISLGQCVRDAW